MQEGIFRIAKKRESRELHPEDAAQEEQGQRAQHGKAQSGAQAPEDAGQEAVPQEPAGIGKHMGQLPDPALFQGVD